MKTDHGIILFDGECNFCNNSVQFIIKRDKNEHFLFASLQSDFGQKILQTYNLPNNCDSFVLIEKNQAFIESQATLHVCRHLNGLWKLFFIFITIPTPIRNYAYRIVAKNRVKWWGRSSSCMIPTDHIKKRFISKKTTPSP